MTLNEMLRKSAEAGMRRTALIYFGRKISYQRLVHETDQIAAALQSMGIKKGDRVAVFLPNCPQFIIAYFGILRAGGIVTSTSPIYTAREAAHQWQDAGASVVFADRALAHVVREALVACPGVRCVVWTGADDYRTQKASSRRNPSSPGPAAAGPGLRELEWDHLLRSGGKIRPVKVRPSDIACLQYTGGTTGTSKGAMLTHGNLTTNAQQTADWLSGGNSERETFVATLPLFHIYATTCVMITAIHCGGCVIILPRFELEPVLEAIRTHRPTFFHGVPTMYVAFNSVPDLRKYGLHKLRVCMSGGAPLPTSVQAEFEKLTGAKLVEGYGLTEASPVTHVNPPGTSRAGSIGCLVQGTQAKIVHTLRGGPPLPIGKEGELCIKGPQVMKGYWGKPRETAKVLKKGWLHTGDIARQDREGYFYIVDRKKDLILVGGFNVYPREVEEALFEHPLIREAGVVGVPDSYRGEAVKAFVVLKPGARLSPDEIVTHCRQRLAAYKVPRHVEFRESLPKSGVGKYLRRELRKPNPGS